MISGYARNCRLSNALMLFGRMVVRDIKSWNSMIKGCLDYGDLGLPRRLFDERNIISWTTMANG